MRLLGEKAVAAAVTLLLHPKRTDQADESHQTEIWAMYAMLEALRKTSEIPQLHIAVIKARINGGNATMRADSNC
jgi:hypothetical protein